MADQGVTYSRIVAFLKVILPLCALALLSTLFLLSRNVGGDSSAAIPFAQVDLEQRAREQQITAPFFSGKTSQGHLVRFTAIRALPDSENQNKSRAEKMDARIDLTDGSRLTFSADNALVNNDAHIATLVGGVLITSSNGFTIRTNELSAAMKELYARSPGRVTGTGPAGDFEAGEMLISQPEGSEDATLLFTKGVKLIYTPVK